MEHIDALEAVRRLTLERDVLAEQVKRLEDSVVWHREELERVSALGEGGNGAPRGCMVPSRTCETCKHAVPGAHAMLCTRHPPHTTGLPGVRGHWPVVLTTDRCGDWEVVAIISTAGCAPLPLPGGLVQCWPAGGIRGVNRGKQWQVNKRRGN